MWQRKNVFQSHGVDARGRAVLSRRVVKRDQLVHTVASLLACVRSYRNRMADYSDMPVLEVWYASIDVEKVLATLKDKDACQRGLKRSAGARARNVLEHDFPKLAAAAGHAPTIKDNPPLIYHLSGKAEKELDRRVPLCWKRMQARASTPIMGSGS